MSIDYVFPYVNCEDLIWKATYNKYCEDNNIKKNQSGNEVNRFRDLGNLIRFVFRSIAENMPWINNIFFIVQSESQVPNWLDKSKVKIVTHDKFIPARYLPTYNSTTIEMFLWNIPDLGEQFIYGNDDLFALSSCTEEDFYTSSGLPKIHLNLKSKDNLTLFRKTVIKGQEMINKDFPSVKIPENSFYRTDHLMSPMLKSTVKQVWNKHKIEICNGISAFRTANNVNQYIYTFYQVFSNQYADIPFNGKYLDTKTQSIDSICQQISDKLYKVICINDSNISTEKNYIDIYNTFNNVFKNKCKYEYDNAEDTKSLIFDIKNTLLKSDFESSTTDILKYSDKDNKWFIKYIPEHKYPWLLTIVPYNYNECFSDIIALKDELLKQEYKLRPIINTLTVLENTNIFTTTNDLSLNYNDFKITKDANSSVEIILNDKTYFIENIKETYNIISSLKDKINEIEL